MYLLGAFLAAIAAAVWFYRNSQNQGLGENKKRIEAEPLPSLKQQQPKDEQPVPTSKSVISQTLQDPPESNPAVQVSSSSTSSSTPSSSSTTSTSDPYDPPTPSTPIFSLEEDIIAPIEAELSSELTDTSHLTLRLEYGVHEIQGKRKEMEDAHHSEVTQQGETTVAFFGVYDGHGGRRAADFAAAKLHQLLKNHPKFLVDTEEALKSSFIRTEKEFMELAYKDQLEDGSTAVVALIVDKRLFIGNVGDSEAVLYRAGKPICLSTLHNPSKNPAEVQRVQDVGGRLYYGRVGHPVINPVLFNIAVSRAIGDIMYKHEEWTSGKKSGLVAEPDIKSLELRPEDEFLILACDGLWDVFSYQSAVDFVKDKLRVTRDPQEICVELVKEAERRDTLDNVTVCLVLFSFVNNQ